MNRGYYAWDEKVGFEVPMQCADCGRPTYYDYADEAYHHAVDAGRGCFLVAADSALPDDKRHPLVARGGYSSPEYQGSETRREWLFLRASSPSTPSTVGKSGN